MNKAIFLDRDGVINEMVFYPDLGLVDSPCRESDFYLIRGVGKALKILKSMGYKLIVITNQPGIAKGRFREKELRKINNRMFALLRKEKVLFDDLYQCMHHPAGTRFGKKELIKKCSCRKPEPGMIIKAAKKHNIDLRTSFFVGDDIIDILTGRNAGCKTVFLGNLRCGVCRYMNEKKIRPDVIFKTLLDFAEYIKKEIK